MNSAYPSPLVTVELEDTTREPEFRHRVRLPRNELFRVEEIFRSADYSLPSPARLDSGVARPAGPLRVWDVGANVGLFALYVKRLDPAARIDCYEPVPTTLALLERNLAGIGDVTIHPFALATGTGESAIHLNLHNTGANSMRVSGSGYGESVPVPFRDAGNEFDALGLERLDVLKVDTEGCEVEILESLGTRVERIDHVLLEYHSDDDRRKLDAMLHDFVVYGSRSVCPGLGVVKYVHRRRLAGG